MKLDDDWFVRGRHVLLAPQRFGKPFAYATRNLVTARLDRAAETSTEGALAHLSPRHRTAARQHMQLYRACLESLGLIPSAEIVEAAVQVEWLWYITPFKRFYRDHLAHVMKVALIAHDLLASPESPFCNGDPTSSGAVTSGADGTGLPIDSVARGLADWSFGTPALRVAARRAGVPEADLKTPAFWRDAVLDAVRIAGLLHDLAYPDDMAGKVATAATAVRPRVPFEAAGTETARHAVAAMQDRLCLIPFSRGALVDRLDVPDRKAAQAAYAISHSPRAAYAMLRMQEASDRRARLTPYDVFVLEWAALGAMMHDLDKGIEALHDLDQPAKAAGMKEPARVLAEWLRDDANRAAISPSFREDPVSFFVALADQLQDFGRMHYADVPFEDERRARARRATGGAGGAWPIQEDRSLAVVRSCYPCRSVVIEARGEAAARTLAVTFDYLGASPFDASPKELAKAKGYKQQQAEVVFGTRPWLRSEGLFERAELVTLTGRPAPAPPSTVPFSSGPAVPSGAPSRQEP